MHQRFSEILAFAFLPFLTLAASAAVPKKPAAPKLIFSDEFKGREGAPVDGKKWTAEIGGDGWGNKELEYYTDSAENAHLDGRGALVIKLIKKDLPLDFKCWYGQCGYTSARLITKNKFDRQYGRFEARIRIPRGQGVWPAFWLLGSNVETVGWSDCGEIDIMENIGREPSNVYGTIHGPGYSGADAISTAFALTDGRKFADDYHVYATEWTKNKIRFYVDDKLYKTITPQNLPAGTKWVYDHPFFVILNLAIGGDWGGAPDASTALPQEMLIDYVRVYRR